jgi:hypothetical protein
MFSDFPHNDLTVFLRQRRNPIITPRFIGVQAQRWVNILPPRSGIPFAGKRLQRYVKNATFLPVGMNPDVIIGTTPPVFADHFADNHIMF